MRAVSVTWEVLVVLVILALLLTACGGSTDDGTCKEVMVTTCAKWVDGQVADVYTETGDSCQNCKIGYEWSCMESCE